MVKISITVLLALVCYGAVAATVQSPVPPTVPVVDATYEYDGVYAVCLNMLAAAPNRGLDVTNGIAGGDGALHYYVIEHHKQISDVKGLAITLLEGPKHGKLVSQTAGGYVYHPEDGFVGVDQVTFSVKANGKKFMEIYSLHVQYYAPQYGDCPDYGVTRLNASKQ
jgi:hypothetical protein